MNTRAALGAAKRIVVKVGSSSLTSLTGGLDPARLDALVDAYVLSFEHGLQKPAAGLFATACSLIGRDPAEVVMVGDDRTADGGAAALGCEVRFVDHLPVSERPDGLRSLGLVPR